jgi:hypothetical protein
MKNKADKDIILIEMKKTTTRLRNQGVDLKGTYFGINDKIREMGNLALDNDESADENCDVPEGNTVWTPEEDFIKIYPDALNKISFRLSGSETLTLFKLIPHINYQSGMLMREKRPLISKDIIELTGFSKVTVISIVERLVEERILAKTRVGRTYEFFVNPYIFFKGKYINHTLLDMFKDYKKK